MLSNAEITSQANFPCSASLDIKPPLLKKLDRREENLERNSFDSRATIGNIKHLLGSIRVVASSTINRVFLRLWTEKKGKVKPAIYGKKATRNYFFFRVVIKFTCIHFAEYVPRLIC